VTPSVAAALASAKARNLAINRVGVTIGGDAHHLVNYQGIALGRGTVWFDQICADDACGEEKFLVRTIDARRK
jgi:hypothetical protein